MVEVEVFSVPDKVVVTFWTRDAAESWQQLINAAGITLRPNGSVSVDQGLLEDARDFQDAIERAWPEDGS
jgi:hypothetical protein